MSDPRDQGEPPEITRFRAALVRRVGLYFDEGKTAFLAGVLGRRLKLTGEPAYAYLQGLESGLGLDDEVRALAHELTVGETYFFRHNDQFRAFSEVALPARCAARGSSRRLRLLSAGCSSGEEAYTLAILAQESGLTGGWEVSIRGLDLNTESLERARRGRYSLWALRETPAELQRRWFHPDGREYVVDPGLRATVSFAECNLALDDPSLWEPGLYDVVFCRNVLMYFTPEVMQTIVARISRSLAPGGYLFLGHAETLRGVSPDFHLRHTHNAFYYQRREGSERSPHAPEVALREPPRALPLPPVGDSSGWIDAVRRSTERIQELTAQTAQATQAPAVFERPARVLVSSASERRLALDLLKQERHDEALRLLDGLADGDEPDGELLLLRAALLAHSGRARLAQETCARLLEHDELNAGARYILALCRESEGDRAGAIEQDLLAIHLDPAFSMPRLHLGVLSRRGGELDRARRELAQAVTLLQGEDEARLVLFGGGFGREGLIALCRAELGRLGSKG